MTASINAPVYMAMFVFSQEFILILFGDQWGGAAYLLQMLSLWALFRSFANPAGSLLFATGRADLAFKWNFSLFFILWPALFLGAHWGTEGLALTQLALMLLLFAPGWYFLVRPLCEATFKEYFRNIMTPFVIATVSAVIAYFGVSYINMPLTRLVTGLIIGGGVYLLMSWLWNKEWISSMYVLLSGKKSSAE